MAVKTKDLLMPVARVGEGSIQKAPEPSRTPFPFMKLPPELRIMVYKLHFSQTSYRLTNCNCWSKDRCRAERSSRHFICGATNSVPFKANIVRPHLLMASKTIYHEVMPTFFSSREFCFDSVEILGAFLTQIGPYHRQYLSTVQFTYEKSGATAMFEIHEAFRLLGSCPNLRDLSIAIASHHFCRRKISMPGFSTLLKIRGIETLDVDFLDAYWVTYLYGSEVVDAKEVICKKLSVLKEPYSPAALTRRETLGITKSAEPRTAFGEKKPDSRAERFERRKKVKEIA
ncbi:MAG: hypothetical protein LQ338_000978 [Usnochroma carphineum]|nr:MAG: hypothetical protein LQ338_000978 [Usnochroma carphineum]